MLDLRALLGVLFAEHADDPEIAALLTMMRDPAFRQLISTVMADPDRARSLLVHSYTMFREIEPANDP